MFRELLFVLPENYPNIYKEKNLNGLRYLLQKKYSEVIIFCELCMRNLILLLWLRLKMVLEYWYLNWLNIFIFVFVLFCFVFSETTIKSQVGQSHRGILYKKLSSWITQTSELIIICNWWNIFACVWLVLFHLMKKYARAKIGKYLVTILKWYSPFFKSCI